MPRSGWPSLLLYRGLPPSRRRERPSRPQPLGPSRGIVYRAGRALQPRLLRRRLRGAVAAGAVAVRALRPVARPAGAIFFWTGLLSALSYLAAVPHRAADRPGQHDGVHAPAGEPLPRPRALRAEPRLGDRAAAGAQRALADGRADAHLLRDGGGHAGRAAGCGERHRRAAQPGRRGEPDAGRLAAGRLRLRLAAAARWRAEDCLRPHPAGDVPARPPARGENFFFFL